MDKQQYIKEDGLVNLIAERDSRLGLTGEMDDWSNRDIFYQQFNQIAKDTKKGIDKIQEERKFIYRDDYVANFLLIHLGILEEDARYTMQDWINFAGDRNEVEVRERDGTLVAIVPAIYPEGSLIETNVSYTEEMYQNGEVASIGTMMRELDDESHNYAEQASMERRTLIDALVSRQNESHIKSNVDKWLEFFDKMGLNEENLQGYRESLGLPATPKTTTVSKDNETVSQDTLFTGSDSYDYF